MDTETNNVRALVVADSLLKFGRDNFGLSHFLGILRSTRYGGRGFQVTLAHRQYDPNADHNDFRFTDKTLEGIDQVWLFAASRTADALSDAELGALTRFMNRGGGVFATGDHEDLGYAMCSNIPRVRRMRKWDFPTARPTYPLAPPGTEVDPSHPSYPGLKDRHDTVRENGDRRTKFYFEDESDVVPQVIRTVRRGGRPHPILGGPSEVIDVLPDHPHEGDCYVPTKVDDTYSFDGVTGEEFPRTSGGRRVLPEVIAWGSIIGGHITTDICTGREKKPRTSSTREFGLIGVYNGGPARVGRIVVDSTWHHFLDVNLIGRLQLCGSVPAGDQRRKGFDYSDESRKTLRRIEQYFRNVAISLLPFAEQQRLAVATLLELRWSYPFGEEIGPDEASLGLASKLELGALAREVLGPAEGHVLAALFADEQLAALDEDERPSPLLREHAELDAAIGGALAALAGAPLTASDDLFDRVAGAAIRTVGELGPAVVQAAEALAARFSVLTG